MFLVADGKYALPVDNVRSIEKMQPVRPVPLSSSKILGVTNLRGVVMTAYDLRMVLGLAPTEETEETRMIVIDQTAYVVDEALDILDVENDKIEPWEGAGSLIRGVWKQGDHLVLIMNDEMLLAI